jgi:hypothetical protein
MLLHGKEVQEHFERRYHCSLSGTFTNVLVGQVSVASAAVGHLSRMSRGDVEQLGREIERLCRQL